jgi:hypothetical protein
MLCFLIGVVWLCEIYKKVGECQIILYHILINHQSASNVDVLMFKYAMH